MLIERTRLSTALQTQVIFSIFVIEVQRRNRGNWKTLFQTRAHCVLFIGSLWDASLFLIQTSIYAFPCARSAGTAPNIVWQKTWAGRQYIYPRLLYLISNTVESGHVMPNASRGLFWRLPVLWEPASILDADSGVLTSELAKVALAASEWAKRSNHTMTLLVVS